MKKFAAFALIVMTAIACSGVAHAAVDFGPVQNMAWVSECHVITFDPPVVVDVTIHVTQDDGDTVTRVVQVGPHDESHMTQQDVTDLVDGHQVDVWTTWTLGTGDSEHLTADCRHAPPTTTTTQPPAPPVPPAEPPTEISTAQRGAATPATTLPAGTGEELAYTDGGPDRRVVLGVLTALGVAMVAAGFALQRRGRMA